MSAKSSFSAPGFRCDPTCSQRSDTPLGGLAESEFDDYQASSPVIFAAVWPPLAETHFPFYNFHYTPYVGHQADRSLHQMSWTLWQGIKPASMQGVRRSIFLLHFKLFSQRFLIGIIEWAEEGKSEKEKLSHAGF